MIIFGNDLQNVANGKLDARLRTRYQVIVLRIVVEQRFDIDLEAESNRLPLRDERQTVVHHKEVVDFDSSVLF